MSGSRLDGMGRWWVANSGAVTGDVNCKAGNAIQRQLGTVKAIMTVRLPPTSSATKQDSNG